MVISFVCLWLLCSRGRGALPGLTRALILWNLELTAITELLSLAGALHLPGVALFWLVSDVWLLTLTVRSVRHGEVHLPDEHTWEEFSPRSHSAGFWVLAAVSALMVFFALFTVTYNWDSMTYHLPRICQWAQNGTVDHYSTHCVRQISSPVLAEYVMLHLYLLTGKSDVLINLVQCLSAVLCGVYSWGIARKLGVSTAFSRLAAMMTLCMPILFAEAFTAEADIYSSLWMMLFAWLLLDFVKADTLRFAAAERHQVLYLAATVSLGYLAKPSVGIGMLVLAAWMGITRLVKRDKLWDLVRLALVAVPMVLLPMIPTSLRNLHSFHSLQSSSVSDELMVGTLQPRFLLANLLKHIFGNLQNGYIPGSAATVNRIVANLGWILQLNINDDAISLSGATFGNGDTFKFGNDDAANPIFMLLLMAAAAWWLVRIVWLAAHRQKTGRPVFTMARQYLPVCGIAFCAMGCTLRWQYWGARLLMPFMVLCIPGIAAQAEDLADTVLKKRKKLLLGLLWAMCMVDLCVMIGSFHGKKLFAERPEGYFNAEHCYYSAQDYQAACQVILDNGWRNVGLYTANDSYEYPIWAMLKSENPVIRHVFPVTDPYDPPFTPDVIFSIDRDLSDGGMERDGVWYSVVWQQGNVSLLRAE